MLKQNKSPNGANSYNKKPGMSYESDKNSLLS